MDASAETARPAPADTHRRIGTAATTVGARTDGCRRAVVDAVPPLPS
jgi:hypothetical protein